VLAGSGTFSLGSGSLKITGGTLSLPQVNLSTNVVVDGGTAATTTAAIALGQSGDKSGTLSGTVLLGAGTASALSTTLTVNSLITLNGVISSGTATTLTVKGGKLLTIGGINTYTGTTKIDDGGYVLAANASAFGASNVVLLNNAHLSTTGVTLSSNVDFGVSGGSSSLAAQVGGDNSNTNLGGTLTVQQAGTLSLGSASTSNTTISGSVQLNKDVTFNVASASTISGSINSGTATGASSNITVLGAGVLTINRANSSFTGTTTIGGVVGGAAVGGAVFAGDSKALGTGNVQLNDKASLDGGTSIANNISIGSSTGSGSVAVTLGGLTLAGTVNVNQAATVTSGGTFAGTLNVNKQTTLKTSDFGTESVTGKIALNSADLVFGGTSSHLVFNSGGTVSVSGTGNLYIGTGNEKVRTNVYLGSAITGTGSITTNGTAGSVALSHSGNTYLTHGSNLNVQNYVSYQTASLGFYGGYLDLRSAPQFLVSGSSQTAIDYSKWFAAIPYDQSAKIYANTGSLGTVFSTPITGQGGLILGSGTLTLAASNSYTADTEINPGATNAKLVLLKRDSIYSSSALKINSGSVDATKDGFTFRSGQLVQLNGGSSSFALNAGSSNLSSANVSFNGGTLVLTGSITSATRLPVKKDVARYLFTPEVTLGAAPTIGTDIIVTSLDAGSPVKTVTLGATQAVNPVYTIDYTVDGAGVSYQTVTRQSYATFATGKTATSLAQYLDAAVSSATAPKLQADLQGADREITDGSTYTEIFNQLSPQAFADMTRTGFERLAAVNAGLEDHIAAIATANIEGSAVSKNGVKAASSASSAHAPSSEGDGWAGWVNVYGRSGEAKADSTQGAAKLKNDDAGTQFGVEKQVGSATVGVTGANGWGSSSFDKPYAKINSDSWHLGLYMVVPVGDSPLSIDGSVLYGLVTNESTRTVSIPAINLQESYKAKFDSRDLSISAGLAFNLLPKGSAFQLAPVLRMSVLNYSQSAVSESAVGANHNLDTHMDKIDATTFLTKLGVRTSYVTKVGATTEFGADASVYWQHDWDSKGRSANASLGGGVTGTSFSVTGRKSDEDTAVINGGLQMTFNNRYTIRGSGAVQTGDATNLTGIVSFGIKF